MSEREEREESAWMTARKKSVPEHITESRLGFETNPPNTLFEGSTLSLLIEKITSLDWSDG
jgi:uncharacterized protein YqgV (UPF0045/DUF77 family)